MLIIFTWFADLIVYQVMGLTTGTRLAESIHFFFEDVSKIYVLLIVMIYLISFLRAGLNTDKIKNYLEKRGRWAGYFIASGFGAITPFCSCSSIPLFLGFTGAGIPLGITMSFLITSPLINEIAVILLGSILGFKFMVIYVAIGIGSGVIGGLFIDLLKADRYLTVIGQKALDRASLSEVNHDQPISVEKISGFKNRHDFAKNELITIFSRVWIWVIAGVGLGAAMHGFIPDNWILDHLGSGQWWSVPGAVLLGIPLYANASGVIPVIETLIAQGLPVGTAMAFMMSVVAASFPEFMMLKQVMKPQLLLIFFIILLTFFTLAGTILNIVF
ncbi:MAG: permease [Spirochaetales bacterium]|nr:permease [Spirochaetales bacterium]